MKDGEGHERICGTAGNMAPNCSCTEGENRRAVHAARGQSPLRCRARSREIGNSSRTDHKPGAEQGFDSNVDEQRDGDEAGHRVWDCETWKCGVVALVLKLQTACGGTWPRVWGGHFPAVASDRGERRAAESGVEGRGLSQLKEMAVDLWLVSTSERNGQSRSLEPQTPNFAYC